MPLGEAALRMPRIRTIKPEFWSDEKLAKCAPLTRLVFLGIISQADDAGRLIDSVKLIDGALFPETDDSCKESLEILARLSRILRYESSSGQRLIQIVGWSKHQKVEHPSRHVLPAPSEDDFLQITQQQRPRRGLVKRSRKARESVEKVSGDPHSSILDHGPSTNDHLTEAIDKSIEASPRGSRTHSQDLGALLAAPIREQLWLGDKPPSTSPGWNMGREISTARQLLEKANIGVEELLGAIEVSREVLGFAGDEPLTLKIFNVDGRLDRLNQCVGAWQKQQHRAATSRRRSGLQGISPAELANAGR